MQQHRRRNRLISGFFSLGLLAGVALAAGPAPAAEGPATSFVDRAWNRKLPAGPRFLVQTDWNSEAVLDKETGLVWERSPQLTVETWSTAPGTCLNKTVGGRKGWRLPSFPELASLIDPSVAPGPTLPLGHPFTNVLPAFYWSATTVAAIPTAAWLVNFSSGAVSNNGKTLGLVVWCVRGGMNAEAY